MARLLVVDDEPSICWGLAKLGQRLGHEVVTVGSAERALEEVAEQTPDALVLDVRLPGMSGLSAIHHFRQRCGNIPIIVITAYGDLQTAVEAVRQGAFDYILKPFDTAKVQQSLLRAVAVRQPNQNALAAAAAPGELVGTSGAMQEVFHRIALAASSEACVLISGESGTGKELVARAVHRYSGRAGGPFVAVNVASLTQSLAESELFGHVRGAFTGAQLARQGLLVRAHGGTLFLDEVADIPPQTQVKLLRAVEHGEVTPVGGAQSVSTNFRVICATHQDLHQKIQEGAFRHDLYFRLCAFRIDILPLRARREDIRLLAEHFLSVLTRPEQPLQPVLSPASLAELERRPWFGNVRELRNAVEHALIVSRGGIIEPEHFPPPVSLELLQRRTSTFSEHGLRRLLARWAQQQVQTTAPGKDHDALYERYLELVEPPLLRVLMEEHNGNCAAAAQRLGIHRTTLKKKLDQYGMADGGS